MKISDKVKLYKLEWRPGSIAHLDGVHEITPERAEELKQRSDYGRSFTIVYSKRTPDQLFKQYNG
jgi:hypothetical protein